MDIDVAFGITLVAVGLLFVLFADQIEEWSEELNKDAGFFITYPSILNRIVGSMAIAGGVMWVILG